MSTAFEQLKQERIIAILRHVPDEQADGLIAALDRAGVVFVEATLNSDGALGMISRWREQYGDRMRIGAGTVLDVNMAKEAVSAGAEYLIAPNLDEAVVNYAREQSIDVYPGAMTPSEIVRAWSAGATAVKIFPMASMGLAYLREIRAPLSHIPMIATGGVRLDNIHQFFQAGATAVGLGGSIVNMDLVKEGRFDEIERNAALLVQAARRADGK
ncbi:bifunctional 4-hydroxy-2-oxoglutarate aldolase/2-dehydro-3-deoxy-phosphogluconate aldolase [Paenibacillus woosongensis]|uniref:Bifunctional 4-hydroxy-2-oxoglutarate aldolase/2-dehydro-3-deoxy-phosphogluconate aldolase n=1 Tax=Paenibacillus woosongensis TaxID=307580 RepID=A0AA95IDU3_9BACL|nr:bifunctional 4-hydroxy-2-oxoglutarate aldolase/2-dehydro-3-deoxy-phosphogluconate aldolase [Paenibacillus woosongensis]WHX51260.1 bifunctional 4-hydroxy-2-oxoglutarate aldolase/2-dehydro-3-deoxy-phosphogluconate aldolase [Paenibacillus woosongensis]